MESSGKFEGPTMQAGQSLSESIASLLYTIGFVPNVGVTAVGVSGTATLFPPPRCNPVVIMGAAATGVGDEPRLGLNPPGRSDPLVGRRDGVAGVATSVETVVIWKRQPPLPATSV